jgi:hypothetical protein
MMDPQCPHADCHCPPSGLHAPYCGPYCANAAEQESLPGEADPPGTCACDHGVCSDARRVDREGPTIVTSTGRA